jgi:DNA (cytosine-5)-methyltransferase 1
MTTYYNEFDPYAAQWLRNLINAGHIAPGIVDERSIEDVRPEELTEFTQCHFFAGIGVWSYALRRAGWPDDRPIWTGSCPCQPFSAAGQGNGFADERHLWPAFYHLIEQCRPASLAGEQVASKDADPWLDLVQTDLEALGYAFGAVAFPSAGVGAPHIRDRTYWTAHTDHGGRIGRRSSKAGDGRDSARVEPERLRHVVGLAYADCSTGGQRGKDVRGRFDGSDAQSRSGLGGGIVPGGLADTNMSGEHTLLRSRAEYPAENVRCSPLSGPFGHVASGSSQHGRVRESQPDATGPTNGIWSAADWLSCRDGKWRPVEPGTFPLVNGAASRVGRLRAYGNAINAEAARVFIEVMMECRP